MVPTGKLAPLTCDFVQTRFPDVVQLSVAVGSVQVAAPVHKPAALDIVILIGHSLITGFWLSVTVTVKLHSLLVIPASSVAV